jgi:leader peptidase (prepilin peptidase)/N-methyltransferase
VLQAFAENTLLFLISVALLSLLVGSFLNVVIHRVPIMLQRAWREQCQEVLELPTGKALEAEALSLVRPRSQCPHCGNTIKARENIPLLSFLFLKGRCSNCGKRISWRYPVVEALTAVLSLIVAWRLGFDVSAGWALLLTWCLIALSFIDLDHQILPDNITLPVLWLGLLANVFGAFTDLQSAVLGAIAGYASLWLVFHGFKLLTGKEGMGFGDFKLFAVFGAWLGWQALPLIILLSAFSGAVIGVLLIVLRGRDRDIPIPFGPYLSVAGWIALLWGEQITRAYLQFARLT